jgi:hypothetical protein
VTRIREDGADRVVITGDGRRTAFGASLFAAAALFAALHGLGGTAAVLLIPAVWLGARTIQAIRSSIVFDGGRREVQVVRSGRAVRVIGFDGVRGIRIVPLGRGFQFGVEVVTTDGEVVELMQTGVVAVAKEQAGRLSTRFHFAALAD